ncbi:hypothetical protein [Parabacteroides hominis]|uniref:DUF4988 domain-containing protein n=1 Tax=Parabacteroides hominis TaxID=2763057 RepID=A0ABR7DPQ3_9BACT|nr:hypothetical protein [Parabacteroides hominis]MBC5632648.1 hypothetical protein [Parabacteroides hominis]
MTGDIILSDGTTITPDDLQKIAAAVEDLIASTAKDPGQYEEVSSLTGVSSLPAFQALGSTYKLVRVALSILKGVDGREVFLQVNQDKTYIQWRYTDGNWQNLVALSDLKGAAGDTPVFRTGSTGIEWKYKSEEDTAYRVLVPYDDLKLKFSDLTPEQKDELKLHFSDLTEEDKAELKGEKGDPFTYEDFTPEELESLKGADGKTAKFEAGTNTSGLEPSISLVKTSEDSQGNPVYTLSIVSKQGDKGEPGKAPVIQNGNILTGDPASLVSLTFTKIGQNEEGQEIYRVDGSIPRGEQGLPGIGSGNVSVEGTGLVVGKKYLFTPNSSDSTSGTFVEYIEPRIPTETSDLTNNSGFITKAVNDLTNYYLKSETYTKEEVQSLISALNSVSLKKVDSLPESGDSNVIYLVPKSGSGNDIYDEYIYIDGKPEHIGSTQVDLSNYVQEAPSDGKTYGRKDEGWAEIKNGELSQDQMDAILDAFNAIPFDRVGTTSITQDQMDTLMNAIPSTLTKNVYHKVSYTSVGPEVASVTTIPIYSGYLGLDEDGQIALITDFSFSDIYYASIGIPSTTGFTISIAPDLSISFINRYLVFRTSGRGTDALMDDGTYKKVFDPKSVTTATTLTNLPIENYSIKVTLSAASALSFASTPAEGWECMIDIKNTGSSAITQALPNASGWQCDKESVTIAAGKIASISVRYVHGTYVVLSKGN